MYVARLATLLLLALPLILALPGCSCGEDDDDSVLADGVTPIDDDDTTAADDDSAFDDDVDDDDSSGGDDADDDDSAIDDDADDDSGDDDSEDDDTIDDDTFDDDSADDDTELIDFDEDLAAGCVELPSNFVDYGLSEFPSPQTGCHAPFTTPDGDVICTLIASGYSDRGADLRIDGEGNLWFAISLGRDLRLYFLDAAYLAAGEVHPDDWTFETVDTMTAGPRFVIDADGVFHFFYTDLWNRAVKYSRGVPGGPWAFSTLDTMPFIGLSNVSRSLWDASTAITIGPAGSVHVVWLHHDKDDQSVRYGYSIDGESWATTILLTEQGAGIPVGYENAIDVAGDGTVHVVTAGAKSNPGWANGALYYLENISGDFEPTLISGAQPTDPSVLAISAGEVYVSFYAFDGWVIRPHVAEKSGDSWIYHNDYFGMFEAGFLTQLSLTANGSPVMYYTRPQDQDDPDDTLLGLHSSTFKNGKWTSKKIFDKASELRLQACENGNFAVPSFAPGSVTNRSINVSYGTSEANSVTSRVTADGMSGSAFAVDDAGDLHIIYASRVPKYHVRYLTNAGGTWLDEEIDPANEAWEYVSIAVANGLVYAAWQDWPNRDLRFAVRENGTWGNSIVVDPSHDTGRDQKMIVFGNGDIGIYYYLVGGIFYEALESNGTWSIDLITDDYNSSHDVFVDDNDTIHISAFSDSGVNYITGQSGDWNVELAGPGHTNSHSAIGVLDDGDVYIAHIGQQDGLYLSSRESGTWSTTIIDADATGGFEVGIIADEITSVYFNSHACIRRA
ncbi:hypothetical protein K8I61_16980, partial [bacterium]|nr:hypothetical protein [bacterium]